MKGDTIITLSITLGKDFAAGCNKADGQLVQDSPIAGASGFPYRSCRQADGEAPGHVHPVQESLMPSRPDETTVARRSGTKEPGTSGVVLGLDEARARRRDPVVRVDVLAGLMREGFGNDPRIDELAARLANLSSEEALALSLAADLDELDAMLPVRSASPADGALPA